MKLRLVMHCGIAPSVKIKSKTCRRKKKLRTRKEPCTLANYVKLKLRVQLCKLRGVDTDAFHVKKNKVDLLQ